jgi:hypothetical protein
VKVSYLQTIIDQDQPFEIRQDYLKTHYVFECKCDKCLAEKEEERKSIANVVD